MKVVAVKSFSGAVAMRKGETRELTDEAVVRDLIRAGYIAEVKPAAKLKKEAKSNDDC